MFLTIGTSPDGMDPAEAGWNHSPIVKFDDSVLATDAALLAL